jgi:hypothetical protein
VHEDDSQANRKAFCTYEVNQRLQQIKIQKRIRLSCPSSTSTMSPVMNDTKQLIMNYLESAHGNLVQAAKIAHLERNQHAEEISKLIDSLEAILEQID